MISKILAGVLAATLSALAIVGYLYKSSLEDNARLEGELNTAVIEYETVRNDLIMKNSDMKVVNVGMRKIAIEYSNKVTELNSLKANKQRIADNPEAGAKAIQQSMDNFIDSINEVTQ